MYFVLAELRKVQPLYEHSLFSFFSVFEVALEKAQAAASLSFGAGAGDKVSVPHADEERLQAIINSVTLAIFLFANRGLLECHKLVFATQCALCVISERSELNASELAYILHGKQANVEVRSRVEWMSNSQIMALQALGHEDAFGAKLLIDIETGSRRWKEWVDSAAPESATLPQDWKHRSPLQKLCILRALRPDRLVYGFGSLVHATLGGIYLTPPPLSLEEVYLESSASTPLLFILSPGGNPVAEVEVLGKKYGFTEEKQNLKVVSCGQGQEKISTSVLELASKNGGWVFLQNIHLTAAWLPVLERLLEVVMALAHKDLRVFLSVEPSPMPGYTPVPLGMLQNSVKITNEPPQSFKASLLRAWRSFTQELLDASSHTNEFRSILFSLCFFHATMLGRIKFGAQGWSRAYHFTEGDLSVCADVLHTYLERSEQIPWEDLRYIFGEIMYGGHITDHWDRRVCSTYLEVWFNDRLFEGVELAAGFQLLPPSSHKQYEIHIEQQLPA
jgi:dynein heavy chain